MTDRRTERVAGYMRHEHANSYAVETGGWTDMFSNKRKQNDKQLREASRRQMLEVMSQALSGLHEQVREMKVEHNNLKSRLYSLEVSFSRFVKEQRAFNKQSAGAIESIGAVIVKNNR